MPELSLTDLIDVVMKSGTPKATKVRQIKQRPAYDPALDFYRPLRTRMIEMHQQGLAREELDTILAGITDPKKLSNYPGAISGYRKWWGLKHFEWRIPPHSTYTRNGCDVIINPELGLEHGGQNYIVKLYFKSDRLHAIQTGIITSLLEASLRPSCTNQEIMAILDVRRGRLFQYSQQTGTIALVNAELAYINALWPNV